MNAATPAEVAARVVRVAGPVVEVEGLADTALYDVVRVGTEALLAEVVRLERNSALLQVYEDPTGLRAGEPVTGTGHPLSVELGPGLLGSVYDGIQRPLPALAAGANGPYDHPFLGRGLQRSALDEERRFVFRPSVKEGTSLGPGDELGTVAETAAILHRVLVPPGRRGTVTELLSGTAGVDDVVARLGGEAVRMRSRWPVRRARPVAGRLDPAQPLITGQRVIDTLFPLARGGAATIPGGFGTGKTVLEQSLARFADADVVVFVACGERGNELTEMLAAFPDLVDPRTGGSLMDRTILVANTSNMPVAAREASIYTGITLAEYYRDQGYHVALLADSTSRWAEALREISGRLEEMPGEEGYPADLASRLAGLYERAGSVRCLGRDGRQGSVSVIGAVSPPGADLSEPVTQHSLRLAGAFWALDTDLARRRHFPAVHWTRSYSHYNLGDWFGHTVAPAWEEQRRWALALLRDEEALLEVVQLLGSETLAPAQHVTLRTGRLLRDGFLQQSAFDEEDAFCAPERQHAILAAVRSAQRAMLGAIDSGLPVEQVVGSATISDVPRLRFAPLAEIVETAENLGARLRAELDTP